MADTPKDSSDSSGFDWSSLIGLGIGAATGGVGTAALAAIPALWKLGAGLFQGSKAKQLENTPRPTLNTPEYSIPPEIKQYLDRTQNRVNDPNLPGINQAEQKLGAQTSGAESGVMQSGHDSGDILNTISKIYGGQMDKQNDLNIASAQNYQGLVQKKDADVNTALLSSAEYKNKKYEADLNRYKGMFDYNQADPFAQAMGTSSALKNASGQNLYGGVNDLSTIATLMSLLKNKQKGTGTSISGLI